MRLFGSRDSWVYRTGFNRSVDFCLWVLEVDGLRVAPFDRHAEGDGSLRAAGLDAPSWHAWLLRVVTLQEAQQRASRQPSARHPGSTPEERRPLLMPEAHQPALAWTGSPLVGRRLAELWQRFGPLANERQAGEPRLAHLLHTQEARGAQSLYDALRPYQRQLATLVIHLAGYAPPISYLIPAVTAVLTVTPESMLDAAGVRERILDAAAGLAAITRPRRLAARGFALAPVARSQMPRCAYRVYALPPAPPVQPAPQAPAGAANAAQQAVLEGLARVLGSHRDIDLSTVCFLREKAIPGWCVQCVSFADREGDQYRSEITLQRRDDGSWAFDGASTSAVPARAHPPRIAIRDHPLITLSGRQHGDADHRYHFTAHGEVVDNGFDVARVRLVNDAGQTFEDTVEDGLVLFATIQAEEVRWPMEAELYDRAGKLIWRQRMLEMRPPRAFPFMHPQ